MDNLILLAVGLFISVLGIMNIRGNINTIHSYNRRKVKEEDVTAYGKAVGTGTLVIGLFCAISSLVSFWNEELVPWIVTPGIVIGIGFILYGQLRYNKGIF